MARSSSCPVALFAYRSRASTTITEADLVRLVQQSWRNNAAAGLTGILVFDRGEFRQILEGPPHRLAPCVARILADPRHHDVQVTRYSLTDARQFDGWTSAGFERFAPDGAPGRLTGALGRVDEIGLFGTAAPVIAALDPRGRATAAG